MFGNYINGEWISTGATFENRNPANTGEVVGTFAKGSAADIDAAAAAAVAAFPGWSVTSGPARGNILYKAADILDKNFESVASDMTREEGKTLPEALRQWLDHRRNVLLRRSRDRLSDIARRLEARLTSVKKDLPAVRIRPRPGPGRKQEEQHGEKRRQECQAIPCWMPAQRGT